MIKAYRIVKRKWQHTAFDGEGARLYGGRWNNKGQACIYTSASESLAILEVLVHLNKSQLLSQYDIFELSLKPKQIMQLDPKHLPSNWMQDPAPSQTAEIGDQWLKSQASLALAVPSSVVMRESNYLLNPYHAEFPTLLKQANNLSLELDPRLLN